MEKRLEWQKHRCLRKDILTVALVGEHWKSVLMPLSSEGITLVLDDGLWREPHTGWGCCLGWFYDCWESCKIHPAVAIGTNSSASMELQGQSKKQTGKKQTLLSQHCVSCSCHWQRGPESSRWGGHDARHRPHSWVRKSESQQLN